jgi:hypothetical protein
VLKKYLNWFLLANVNVFDSVELVFQLVVVTELTVESDPEPAASNFPLNVAVTFALKAAYAEMVLPDVGFVIDVIVVPWWLARRVFFVNKLAQLVACTVSPTVTDPNAPDCPYPRSSSPTPSIVLILATAASPVPAAFPVANIL